MYEIVTLCGSTKFKNEFIEANKRLTLDGKIVLSVGFFEQSEGIELSKEQFKLLKELHFEKIRISDEVFIINPNGYLGESTKSEITYAESLGKKVSYLEG